MATNCRYNTCIIGLIVGLAAEDEANRMIFGIFGGGFGLVLLILPLAFRPVIKAAERRLSKFAFMENSIKALDDDVFIKQFMQATMNKEFEDHKVKIFKHCLVYSETHCSDCEYPMATIANHFGKDSSVIGIRKTLIDTIKRDPELRNVYLEDITHHINIYYSDTIEIIGNEDVIDSIAMKFFGTATPKQKSDIKEMLLWIEKEKDHTISKMLSNRCGIKGRFDAFEDLCKENKDTFIKILNERNSTSNSTDNNGKLTIGNVVLN